MDFTRLREMSEVEVSKAAMCEYLACAMGYVMLSASVARLLHDTGELGTTTYLDIAEAARKCLEAAEGVGK